MYFLHMQIREIANDIELKKSNVKDKHKKVSFCKCLKGFLDKNGCIDEKSYNVRYTFQSHKVH